MARITILNLLTALQAELATQFNIDAEIRYTRVGDQVELSSETKYYLELGSFQVKRSNTGSAQVLQEVRLLSEESASYATLDSRIEAIIETFERVSRDVMRTPSFVQGAFLQSVAAFTDAPTCYVVDAAEEACNVFGGVAFTFSIE